MKSQDSIERDPYGEDTLSDYSDDSYEIKPETRPYKAPVQKYNRRKPSPSYHSPYQKPKKKKLVLKKGEVTPHERLYALAAKSRIKKKLLTSDDLVSPQNLAKKFPNAADQVEYMTKLAKEKLYHFKRGGEEIEDYVECTFKPEINKSQKYWEGRRQKPIYEPSITNEVLENYKKMNIEKEMKGCTFKPHINKKSLRLVNHANKRKQEEEERNKKDNSMIFPMKEKVKARKEPNKASMFFSIANNKGIEKINKEKERYNSLRNTPTLNSDIYGSRTYDNTNTPQFEEILEDEEELPLPGDSNGELHDEQEFDRLVKQVIFDNNGYESPKFTRR